MRAVNLIPAEQSGARIPTGRSGGSAYVVLALLAGLALMALLYGKASHDISSSRAQVASLTARAEQAQTQATQLAPYTSFVALREQRVQDVDLLVSSRFDWANALYEVGRVLPANAAITTLEGAVGSTTGAAAPSSSASSSGASGSKTATSTTASTAVTSATPPGSIPTITIAGCAASQAQVAFTLQRLRLITGVREVQLQSSSKSGASGAKAGSEGCSGGEAAFNVQVVFEPLPSIPTTGGSGTTATVSTPAAGSASGTGAAAKTPTTTSSSEVAR